MTTEKTVKTENAKTEQDWQAQLTPEQFNVLRKAGTESPFSSELLEEKGAGVYHCAGCDAPLFESAKKFDSGTGWPSFYAPIEGAVNYKTDYKMVMPRTEYHCANCGGHLGHVFKDVPAEKGQRYCNNGVALYFVARH